MAISGANKWEEDSQSGSDSEAKEDMKEEIEAI